MGKLDRRQKLALDEAYRLFRVINKEETPPDLYQLVKCLQTVNNALNGALDGQLKLTIRLWRRIHLALFDKLFTSYSAHLVIYTADGEVITPKQPIPDDAVLEIHPEGLRRADDFFKMPVENLYPDTRQVLNKVWTERGNAIRREDFTHGECTDYCTPKHIVIGDDVLTSESQKGKEQAYAQWWDLYWLAYCTYDNDQKKHLIQQMESIEAVWGNLYY